MLKNLKCIIKYSFWDSVDNFFVLIFVNFLWFFIHFIPVYLFISKETFYKRGLSFFNIFDLFSYTSNYFLTSFPFIFRFESEMTEFMKNFHQLTFLGILIFFSPFSLSVWKLNAEIGSKKFPKIKNFFIESYRQVPRSLLFIFFGTSLLVFCSINISFYQNVFSNLPFMAYLSVYSILFLEFFVFICFLQAIPVMMNENKKIIPCLKRSYLFLIHFFPSSSVLFLSFCTVLLLIYWQPVPELSFILIPFVYPAFWGQFMNEHYLSSAEYFGLDRAVKEKKSFKKWIFPKSTSQ